MGTFSGPEQGTSTLEKRQRSIKMKGTSTVELQMELQKVYVFFAKKKLLQEIRLCVDGKAIQKDFTKIYEILEFGLRSFSDVSFGRKGSLERTVQVP